VICGARFRIASKEFPYQFFSEEEILDAAAGPDPEITLVPTDEAYRCSVVGNK
jgi:hypothetical protein